MTKSTSNHHLKDYVMLRWALLGLFVLPATVSAETKWKRIQIDGVFRAEGVAAGDFNKDGQMDVAAGDYWFAAPDWKRHQIRQPLDRNAKPAEGYDGTKGYSNTFASWAYDVNGDGWTDVINIGYPGAPCYWYENPKNADGMWKQSEIWHSACNETPLFTDITGDGQPELIMGSQPERQLGYLSVPPADKCYEKWKFVAINEAGEPNQNGTFLYYHGLGTGDVNQDGRLDVIIPHGWYEAPKKGSEGLWAFHPLNLSKNNDGKVLPASNIFVLDLDLDGDEDIVMSSAHAFGIWWFENPGKDSTEPFKYHLIDESFSQTHALALVDLAGDKKLSLVTGKRYFAHQGSDPGGRDPVVMYQIGIHREKGQSPKFDLQEIVAGKDTGVGTQFEMIDFNKDGKLDIVLSNKKGVNVLIQE